MHKQSNGQTKLATVPKLTADWQTCSPAEAKRSKFGAWMAVDGWQYIMYKGRTLPASQNSIHTQLNTHMCADKIPKSISAWVTTTCSKTEPWLRTWVICQSALCPTYLQTALCSKCLEHKNTNKDLLFVYLEPLFQIHMLYKLNQMGTWSSTETRERI